jgi:hypothetical protein
MAITSKGKLPRLHIPKTSRYFCYIFLETIILGIIGVRAKKTERLMWENDTSSICCLDGRIFGTERNEHCLQENDAHEDRRE